MEHICTAMEGHIELLNYAAHALEEMNVLIPRIKGSMPGIRQAHEAIASYLHRSVKFLLPNCAEMIDLRELRQVHVDMARPPFEVMALEASWILPDGLPGHKGAGHAAPRRIALCLNMNREVAAAFPATECFLDEPAGGVVVIPIYWQADAAAWKVPLGGVFLPHQNPLSLYRPEEASLPTRLVNAPVEAMASGKPLQQFRVAPFALLPEWHAWAVEQQGSAAVKAQIVQDCRDEVAMLLQTCCVLNCDNVASVERPASVALNKRRMRRGKQPFFSYRVFEVDGATAASDGTGPGGGTAGPRTHVRRGHIRRLKEKLVWVRAAIVNAGSPDGLLHKSYRLRQPQ